MYVYLNGEFVAYGYRFIWYCMKSSINLLWSNPATLFHADMKKVWYVYCLWSSWSKKLEADIFLTRCTVSYCLWKTISFSIKPVAPPLRVNKKSVVILKIDIWAIVFKDIKPCTCMVWAICDDEKFWGRNV